jgi:hypothetical protein
MAFGATTVSGAALVKADGRSYMSNAEAFRPFRRVASRERA